MKTYQDYLKADDKLRFVVAAINDYRAGDMYRTALIANEYERQRNVTISEYHRYLYTQTGQKVVDFTAANNRLANNFFHRLNTDRCTYSLGNGVSFTRTEKRTVDGNEVTVDLTKEALGTEFDNILYRAAYFALIHGVSYVRWEDNGSMYVFTADEFCPLYDEYTGQLRAGIRFWSLDWAKRPATVVLYTEDGYTVYRTKDGSRGLDIAEYEPPRAYRVNIVETAADGAEIVGESNYGALPIVPLWGSKNKQSTLVGMRSKLDAYDLIQSGFANDLEECAEIYWLIGNAMGMDGNDLARFRDNLKLNHIAVVDTENTEVTAHTKEVPYAARKTFLDDIRASLYEDFGDLDVHTIAAGATNDHIDAGYQPMDEEADDFEYQIIQFVRRILAFMGIDDTPQFKRNRVSNLKEQTETVLLAAEYMDAETVLRKLPFVTVDEIQEILRKRDVHEARTFGSVTDDV